MATYRNELYKCQVCGIVAEILSGGAGEPVCCGQAMTPLRENCRLAGRAEHIPIVQKSDGGVVVRVGSLPHPMDNKHYVEWIELIIGPKLWRQHLSPGQQPEAQFPAGLDGLLVRQHCNLHGLWQAQRPLQ